jgi:hypothetical protein
MLWDTNWALIDQYGFDSDFYNGSDGNNILLSCYKKDWSYNLVADLWMVEMLFYCLVCNIYRGANACIIWNFLLEEGLKGVSADQEAYSW